MDLKADSGGRTHNVYAELFGSSNIVGVNYDTRFVGSSVFGWRAGVGYSISRFRGDAGWFGNIRDGISLPVCINALIGRKSSKFEVGIGVAPGVYSYRDSRRVWGETEHGYFEGYEDFGPTTWRGSCALGLDLGYRLATKRFLFRIGLSPYLDIKTPSHKKC